MDSAVARKPTAIALTLTTAVKRLGKDARDASGVARFLHADWVAAKFKVARVTYLSLAYSVKEVFKARRAGGHGDPVKIDRNLFHGRLSELCARVAYE